MCSARYKAERKEYAHADKRQPRDGESIASTANYTGKPHPLPVDSSGHGIGI